MRSRTPTRCDYSEFTENMNPNWLSFGLVLLVALLGRPALAQQFAVRDLGTANPISCDFLRYNYCQSEASLNGTTSFTPLSDPPPDTIVHFAYRGPGNSNYLKWPSNFKASSANGISHSPTLVQYIQVFAT